MITKQTDLSTDLTSTFKTRLATPYLDESLSEDSIIKFCRKVGGVWLNRDVTALWLGHSPLRREIAAQIGISEGQTAEFMFDNSPLTTLSSAYSSGTSLSVKGIDAAFQLSVNDWIAISSYSKTEYRRISSIGFTNNVITTINITEALDNTYPADETEIRFAWMRNNTNHRADKSEEFQGWVLLKTGFDDLAEYMYMHLARIGAGEIDELSTVTVSAIDRIQALVEYELTHRIEFDDRGVASVPTESGWVNPATGSAEGTPNGGNGTISDVTYNYDKRPDVLTTETWTLQAVKGTGTSIRPELITWRLTGSVTGLVSSGQEGFDTYLPDDLDALPRSREWSINVLEDYGWSLVITEGKEPFADGDTFKLHTQASGTVAVVKGKGYTTNPIDASTLVALYPSYIVEYVIKTLLGWTYDNPEGITGDLIFADHLTAVRALPQDFLIELRGQFEAGERAIHIIDDALKVAIGYIYQRPEGRIGIQYYHPMLLDSPTGIEMSRNEKDASRLVNVSSLTRRPFDLQSTLNKIRFKYNTGDTPKEVTAEDTDSQDSFGVRSVFVRGEGYTTKPLDTRFDVDREVVQTSASRYLNRLKLPLDTFNATAILDAIRLEPGDIASLYARSIQVGGETVWVKSTEAQLRGEQMNIVVECEGAANLNGKYAKFQSATPPAANTIWDSTGFIGSDGEERLGWFSDATDQLDILGNNDGDYDAQLGKPDRFGNYVEDTYIFW